MPDVHQVETPVGEHDALPLRPIHGQNVEELLSWQDLRAHGPIIPGGRCE